MLGRMNRTRLAALAVLGFTLAAACTSKLNNGEECLKNADCESDRCIQYVCVEPTALHVPTPVADTGVAAETAVETGTDAGVDSGKDAAAEVAAETSSDTSAD
jgi:hypothetical protein